MNAREDVFLDNLFADEDGILEVVAVPRHKRYQHVTAKSQFPVAGARSVNNDLAFAHGVPFMHQNLLVDTGGGIGPHELADRVNPDTLFRVVLKSFLGLRQLAVHRYDYLIAVYGGDFASFGSGHDRTGIARHALLKSGGNQRRFGDQQWHCLSLHVRPHQGTVGVVVFQEWNQRSGHRNELLRRHVHEVHFIRLHVDKLTTSPANHTLLGEHPLVIHRRVSLSDEISLFTIGCEIVNVSTHTTTLDFAIGSF